MAVTRTRWRASEKKPERVATELAQTFRRVEAGETAGDVQQIPSEASTTTDGEKAPWYSAERLEETTKLPLTKIPRWIWVGSIAIGIGLTVWGVYKLAKKPKRKRRRRKKR